MPGPAVVVPPLEELAALAQSADLGDRAFAASVLQLAPDGDESDAEREQRAALYERVRQTAEQAHRELRGRIAAGLVERSALLAELGRLPLELRDHWLEEVLGIAYPPLVARALPADSVTYSPSGVSEILFMLERARLASGQVLVDLGSGLGKVVLLTTLLSRARAVGIELDGALVTQARAAAESLGLSRASFVQGDLHDVELPDADVYYMFIPLQRSAHVLPRLEPIARRRHLLLFAQELDLRHAPWLERTGRGSYWLEHFESRP